MAPMIKAIATKLISLQSLDMEMGMDTKWCYWFSNLVRLKKLKWTVRHMDEAFIPLAIGSGENRAYPEETFLKVFESFDESPCVTIELKWTERFLKELIDPDEVFDFVG